MNVVKYMLDTHICIYLIKKAPIEVIRKFKHYSPGEIAISSVTMAELHYGANKNEQPMKNLFALENFFLPLQILPFDDRAAMVYGQTRAFMEKNGTPIGSLDTMIGSHAKSLGLRLVTNNVKEFSRIPELRIENWARSEY